MKRENNIILQFYCPVLKHDHMFFRKLYFTVFLLFTFSICDLHAQDQDLNRKLHTNRFNDSSDLKAVMDVVEILKFSDSIDKLLDKVYERSRTLQYHWGEIHSLSLKSLGYQQIGQYSKSLYYNLQAINKSLSLNSSISDLSILYNNRAITFSYIGESDSSFYYFQKAISKLSKFSKAKSKALIYINYGNILSQYGRHKKSIFFLKKAMLMAKKENEFRLEIGAYHNLAIAYGRLENADSFYLVRQYLHEASNIAVQHNYPDLNKATLNALSILSDRLNDKDSAKYYITKSLEVNSRDNFIEYNTMLNAGVYFTANGEFSKAEEVLKSGLKLAMENKEKRAQFYYRLGQLYSTKGYYKKSNDYFLRFISLNDSLEKKNMMEKVNDLEFRFETAQKDKEIANNKLKIISQKITIQRKSTVINAIISIFLIVILFVWLIFRNRWQLRKQQEQQRIEMASWRASLIGEEKERKRIAHLLHDNIAGDLSMLSIWLTSIKDQILFGLPLDQQQNFNDSLSLLQNTLTEVRNTAHQLVPEQLLRLGLAEAIRIHCNNIEKATGLKIHYHYFGYIGAQGKSNELIIYRSIQELIHNINKHAEASQVIVQLSQHKNKLSITVEDNGKGWDTENENLITGIGLINIRQNIQNIGGELRIQSEKGNGTTIEIEINIENENHLIT